MHGERTRERGEEEERITERERGKWGLGWLFSLFIFMCITH
jgi:hypothetical protein